MAFARRRQDEARVASSFGKVNPRVGDRQSVEATRGASRVPAMTGNRGRDCSRPRSRIGIGADSSILLARASLSPALSASSPPPPSRLP